MRKIKKKNDKRLLLLFIISSLKFKSKSDLNFWQIYIHIYILSVYII